MALTHEQEVIFSSGEFFQKTLDCLRSHIAILDQDGTIVAVNTTWNKFAASNGLAEKFCGPGANYLRSCDQAEGECSEEAQVVANGIRDVIARRREYFYLEYPCHSPSEQRWFSVRITRFDFSGAVQVVVAHDNITQRKLAEVEVEEANRLLVDLAATDGLTGIPNRRSFDMVLEREWKRSQRTQSPITVALVDIDCFKQFNDLQGHLVGDDCLKSVAQSLQSRLVRTGDFVARYGGEEFAIILPITEDSGAMPLLEDVLQRVRGLSISHPASMVARGIVTVSIGCASTSPGQEDRPESLLRQADHALYEAKTNGRDQLMCASHAITARYCS